MARPRNVSTAQLMEAGLGKTTDRVVASKVGISHQGVAHRRRKLGIKPFTVGRIVNAPLRAIYALLVAEGLTCREIAEKLGMGRSTVWKNCKAFGLEINRVDLEILDWSALRWTKSNKILAKETGISQHRIANVRCRLRRQGMKIPRFVRNYIKDD